MTADSPEAPSWLDRSLYPFESRVVAADGHRVHYVDEGDGPILLMIHGNPTWSFVYRDVITSLRGEFRCIALDLPGFGLSEAARTYGFRPEEHAATVAAFVRELDLHGVTLIGQDWGGPIGLAVAQGDLDRFECLILANTWAWPVNGDFHFEVFSRLMGGLVGRELIRTFNLFVNAMVPAGHQRKLTDAEMRHYREPLSTRRRRHASAVLPQEILRSRDFLERVEDGMSALQDLPSLLLWGDRDIAFRETEKQRWASLLPAARVVDIPGAGHWPQSDDPAAFVEAIRAWWPVRHQGR